MPGIAGVIGKTDGGANATVASMIASMTHEPHYVGGTYANDTLRLCVGWLHHAGSFADVMPVWNDARDVCLIFSGETFVDRDALARRGLPIGTDITNARYLARLYEALGSAFFEELNGWFSGVLIDLRRQEVTLFNDRYGLGRIYYHHGPDAFYFASEAKALLRVRPELRRIEPQGLAESVKCGAVLQDRTLFAGVRLLPPASKWRLYPGPVATQIYFSRADWERQPPLAADEFEDALKHTFRRVLSKYLSASVPVAMSLTGGLDGRMIMAVAKAPPGHLPTYTFNGPYRDCADLRIGRRIAGLCGQPHRTIAIEPDFFSRFSQLAEKTAYVSDGLMDPTGAVELYVNERARHIAPVRLTGNYGSEIIRGNVAFRPEKSEPAFLVPEFARLVREAAQTWHLERSGSTLSFIAFKQTPWHHYARLCVEQSQLTVRSPYLDNELVALMYRAPREIRDSKEASLRLIRDAHAGIGEIPTDRGEIYDDSAIFGKARVFLTGLLVKAEYAYDYGMPPRLAAIDRLLAPLRPEKLFLGHQKFYHFRVWYRDQLAEYLREVLLDQRSRSRPYLRGGVLERMVLEHTTGARNWTRELHRLLALELLHRTLIER